MDKLVMVMLIGLSHVPNSMSTWDRCGGRLERALDSMQRDVTKRNNRHDDDESGVVYQRSLSNAPFIMTVARVAVKLPQDSKHSTTWAKVEKCNFEPTNQSLKSRVMMNELTVSGLVSLIPQVRRSPIIGESCHMTLRLKRAGIDFTTTPISRTHGQMRIRTESSFLEPRFASIYAYGCRPVGRIDRQIKRHDKPSLTPIIDLHYDLPEPRNDNNNDNNNNNNNTSTYLKDEDIQIANENTTLILSRNNNNLSINNKKHQWITKLSLVKRKKRSILNKMNLDDIDDINESKHQLIDNDDDLYDWQSRDNVAHEMEDIFLHGASEALTKYVEKQLHPAIKETLMVSMGYTISYG